MDLIPTLRRPTSIMGLAEKVGISEVTAREYLNRWAEKGLLEIK